MIYNIRHNLQELDKAIVSLQETIIYSRLKIFHPSLLTYNEIEKFQIDVEKLKHISLGYARSTDGKIIFLIKIPLS